MRALAPREARLVAVLILLAVAALVQFAIIGPILTGFAERSERRQELLARYDINERTIAAIPRLRRQAEHQRGAMDNFTLAAPDAAAASEMLKERLQRAVEAAGGEFRGAEEDTSRPGWTAARIVARLSAEQLVSLLARVQNDRPYVIVDELTVAADEALIVGHAATLDVQFEASLPLRAPAARQ